MLDKIPNQIKEILKSFEKAGFEAYIVGGCVRDLLMKESPKDWDIATNAKPEEILKIFPDGKYENTFGTVIVPEKYLHNLPATSKDIKLDDNQIEKLKEVARDYISKIDDKIHGIRHAGNVVKYSLEIGREYKQVNLAVLEIAALFHDVGRAKYPGTDKKHIAESRRILGKELASHLNKTEIKKILEIIQHDHETPSQSLEQEIIREADIIDGIDIERVKKAIESSVDIHIEWIKEKFNKNQYYSLFVLPKGRELLSNSIQTFNGSRFDFEIPDIEIAKNQIVEITTYRIESKYSDKRHPDVVKFAKTLEEDLSRRDFTINALAIKILNPHPGFASVQSTLSLRERGLGGEGRDYELVDLFNGKDDLKNKIIRAVGNADDRFNEDALRMMRAIRFASTLNGNSKSQISISKQISNLKSKISNLWNIEKDTAEAIKKNAKNLKFISQERIKDEISKIILSETPADGIEMLHKTGLLEYIIPELEKGVGVAQNRHHIYTIWKHSILSLKFCPSKKLEVRLAALLHDIAKPQTKRGEGEFATFYNHDHVGARVAEKILTRLRFSNDVIQKVRLLIDSHMFYYNPDEVSESSVRRLVQKVGLENMKDLIDLRISDRLGSGVPKAKPYKLRHLEYIIDKVSHDAVSVKMLKINGNDLMKELKIQPGPKIGAILDVLLSEVIEDASKNNKEFLLQRASVLDKEDLIKLRQMAKVKIEEKKEEEDKEIKEKHWVK